MTELIHGVHPSVFTGCELHQVETPGSTLAWGWLEIVSSFRIKIRLMQGKYGKFVAMPSHKGPDKTGGERWYDDVETIKFYTQEDGERKIDPTKPNIQAAVNEYVETQYNNQFGNTVDQTPQVEPDEQPTQSYTQAKPW